MDQRQGVVMMAWLLEGTYAAEQCRHKQGERERERGEEEKKNADTSTLRSKRKQANQQSNPTNRQLGVAKGMYIPLLAACATKYYQG